MELPSMVQKSGGTLIVRSVVSGIPIYTDEPMEIDKKNNKPPIRMRVGDNPSSFMFGEHLEELKRAQEQLMQQQQQSLAEEHQRLQAAAMELKEEGLPQCKIKRNYSCNYCTYFTQNPRYHLTHLRDVHGEKIVINKCKLCLYASRHYQKLVRHMKMVHGCTDGIASSHGQARGKRGINREARKRKLEETVPPSTGVISAMSVEAINAEHAKSDMEREQQKLQREIEVLKKQQEVHQKSQQQKFNEAIFAAAAFEQQLRVQREFDNRETLKSVSHSNYEQQSPPVQKHEGSPSHNRIYDNATPAHSHHSSSMQLPPQRSSIELTPSPSGSNSSPPPSTQLPPPNGQQLQDGLSGGSDEPSNNRLMKCSLCDFTTLYRNLLLEHEIEDHCNAKFYRCEKCSYVTHIKARFSKHVKYHSMPMIKCVTCDFRTPYKWNLDRHMKNHGGAGPFKCAACDFTADIKQSLTVHEMNHHVPPVGHAAGMTLARRRNKVGGTDLNEDFFSDSAEMLEDHFNNNNMDEYDEMLMTAGPIGVFDSKRLRYDDDEPTDLSQKGGSSDTSSVHNSNLSTPKARKPLPNLIPITKESDNILNLSSDLASRSSLSDIASMFFNEKQISEMMQPTDKSDAIVATTSQLSPTTTIASSASTKSILNRKPGSFFEKIKSSSTTNENLICPCGHMAKCLSESIIHRKTCTFSPLSNNDDIDLDDDEHDEDGEEGRLEIDFTEDDECDKQSHSALNLSVSGSTRCQHCRHRCKSSADLLNHLKICCEANSRCDSLSGDSCAGSRTVMGETGVNDLQHPMENRVFIWNKLPRNQQESGVGNCSQSSECNRQQQGSDNSASNAGSSLLSVNTDENSYYGVETAPGYGEVTKKMTPEEEAANSSLKKVYKCPHCSFWASTASRFHVHIVGHLNKKPFECSLCSYRSNWRWDITKHIRLKTIRDPSHKNARVLMNDETGRRNYTKYNKYITLMKVTEEDGDPKLMKSGEMTPNQVASLAFINDFNNKQQGSNSATISNVNNILNGAREDITLEPITTKPSVANVDDQLSDNFIRLPLLASMMNAAIAQQQQQHHNDNEPNSPATLITPSVTISAVKKSPPSNQNFKPSDEITLEIRQEGKDKITNYKCRKCNFRHSNRDAVLAHVKVHFPDTNQSFHSPKMGQQQQTGSLNNNGSMQAPPINSNLYMNKVLAAMCLSQQHHSSNPTAQLSNLMAAGLLDPANNSQLSGLALALAGKSPVKATHLNAAANIIEHGEQKASLNERHCRLKHAGVINIETLDRSALADRHVGPIYKPLVNGTTNEANNNNSNSNNNNVNSHFNLTLKALQQQQQQQHQNQNNSQNNVLINSNNHVKNVSNTLKSEPSNNLLPSSITASSALNATNASQDLQAAAVAYLAAAAAAVANQNNNLKAINSMTEELILQQQLQQNDQIEITRVSSTNQLNNNNSSNHILSSQTPPNNSSLAQLLETNLNTQLNRVSSPQNNVKSKQQKCPLCTYICDSKSQMNYHISLHKPTQYECRMCTFVCAKKQHLSSHMRTVHQVVSGANSVSAAANTNINMDFNLVLQMASVTQNQESSNFSAPLAIDLSPSPVTRSTSTLTHNQQGHQNQLPPEYQYRMIYYCSKCPARYAQKHNDPLTAQRDLDEHLKQHEVHSSADDDKRKYDCDYCDYRAMHESIIQTHRYVHTTQYQEKCNELYKNCKEDSVYRAPKLMHITATKKPHMHETIWVVDHDLNEGHQQNHNEVKRHQNSIISSSSQNNYFASGNSLLKKQLESRQVTSATLSANEEVRGKLNHTEAEDSNTASTLASVATGDLAHDNEPHIVNSPEALQLDKSASINMDNKEKCEHCPFESSNAEEFKTHIYQHICVSQQKLAHTCEHCDYSADEQEHIDEHTRVHFNGIQKLKDVSFFTRYDKLELSMEQQQDDEDANGDNLNIKKELQNHNHNNKNSSNNNNNNNNEEDRVNENLKDAATESIKISEQKQPKCAKIILYKNDGCLTIKKESSETQSPPGHQQQQINTITENISDRLRRRISRQGATAANIVTSNQLCATSTEDQSLTSTSTSSTSHKTILVNAKTGQVISRN